MNPNPTSAPRIAWPEQVRAQRWLDCVWYSRCLEVAVRRDWDGFTCRACELFIPPTPEEARADAEALVHAMRRIRGRARLRLVRDA